MRLRQVLLVIGLVLPGLWLLAVPAAAHHGGTGDYDGSRPLYLSGTVTDVRYGYPHAVLRIEVPADLTVPGNLDGLEGVEEIRGHEFWQGGPAAEGAGEQRDLLLPPDMTGTIGAMPDRPAVGDELSAIAYRRCDDEDGSEYAGELRVQWIGFADETLTYQGTITRITDGCPDHAEEGSSDDSSGGAEPIEEDGRAEATGTEHDTASDDGVLEPLLHAFEENAVAERVRTLPWLYPILESTHIAGIALLVGSAALFDLRLLGAARRIPVATAARQLLPWSRVGFGIVALTGALMFIANAESLAENPAVRWKAVLILLAGVNAAVFQFGPYRRIAHWDGERRSPIPVRAVAVISLALWLSIIACGRLIAYV